MKLSHENQRNTSAMGSLSVHRKKTAILVIAILSVLLVTAGVFYVNDYYHADESVQELPLPAYAAQAVEALAAELDL